MLTYQKATLEHLEELVRLRLDFMQDVTKRSFSPEENASMTEALKVYFRSTLPGDDFIAWLAYEAGQIVGTSGLCFYCLPPSVKNRSGKVAYIMNMYTIPSHRGRGIAPALFDKLLAEARQRGYEKICLHATEMGRPVYERFGFKNTHDEMILNLK